jgi:MFS family permease
MSKLTARQEWSAHWPVPFVAMAGGTGSALFAFSSGVFMKPMLKEFGWTKVQFSSSFTVMMMLGMIMVPIAGRLTDRYGPRRLALPGLVLSMTGLSMFGLMNGSMVQWLLMAFLFSLCGMLISVPIWSSAIVRCFDTSRGLALSIAMAGAGLATAIWPPVAAYTIETIGWRAAYPALAASWGVVILPLTWWFFIVPPPAAKDAAELPAADGAPVEAALTLGAALRSPAFIMTTIAGLLFAGITFGLTLHFVPILEERGLSEGMAAGLAGIVGISSLASRFITGYLLDRVPTAPLAVVAFLLPVAVCCLLWRSDGDYGASLLAAVLHGLGTGAEINIVIYAIARRFPQAIFGSIIAIFISTTSLAASVGPLLASFLYDERKSYDLYLIIAMPLLTFAAILMWVTLATARKQPAGGMADKAVA